MTSKCTVLFGAIAIAASLTSLPAAAAEFVLTNGSGDGQVRVGVDGYGSFGSSISTNASDAFYNPVGSGNSAGTTYQSGVALRLLSGGGTSFLSTGISDFRSNPTVTGTSTLGSSSFTVGGLVFNLTQTLTNLFSGGVQNGTRLDQIYTITNSGTDAIAFDLIRYFDGDLLFDGSASDGGGLINGSSRTLFETDSATGSATDTTFIGITGEGGAQAGYEVSGFSGLRSRILNGTALGNTVQGDGADADTFIDAGAGYDVTLALGNRFNLAAGGSAAYATSTLFGSGAPATFTPGAVPEPATWAMMLVGFGGIGFAMRRRKSKVSMTVAYA